MAGKKKTEKQLIKEISKLAAEVTLGETETKKKKSKEQKEKMRTPELESENHKIDK